MTQPLTRIKGLLPAIDRKQTREVHCVDGQNFLVDVEGPHAAFGSELITKNHIPSPEFVETFRIDTEIFLFTNKAVYKFNETADVYYPIVVFDTSLDELFPWSSAQVGGKYYFTKKGASVYEYDPITGYWSTLAGAPANPYFVTKSAGRLIITSRTAITWSAIDAGSDLVPDVDKGVGFQLLAIVGNGEPLACLPTFDGFITYTKTGALKSEIINSINPFRHFPLTGDEDFIPLSQWTVIEAANNEHIILAKTGLWVTTGKVPQQWQPLFSEYLRRQILISVDLSLPTTFKLSYNSDRQWFILSFAENEQQFFYTKAWVLYVPVDEWGIFNRPHTGFGEISIAQGTFAGFNFGYICPINGCLNGFTTDFAIEFPQNVESPDRLLNSQHFFHTTYEIPARKFNNEHIMPSIMQMSSIDESVFVLGSGVYEYGIVTRYVSPTTQATTQQDSVLGTPNRMITDLYGADGVAVPGWFLAIKNLNSVDAFVSVGLLQRDFENAPPDLFTLVTDITIGMGEQPPFQEFDDWLSFLPDTTEDWLNDPLDDEDWGFGVVSGFNYALEIIGTNDGYNQFQDQFEIPDERIDIVDAGADETTGRKRYFTCYNNGIYHILTVRAQQLDHSFHVKFLDINMVPAGVI